MPFLIISEPGLKDEYKRKKNGAKQNIVNKIDIKNIAAVANPFFEFFEIISITLLLKEPGHSKLKDIYHHYDKQQSYP